VELFEYLIPFSQPTFFTDLNRGKPNTLSVQTAKVLAEQGLSVAIVEAGPLF
jgi:hypothetical protein